MGDHWKDGLVENPSMQPLDSQYKDQTLTDLKKGIGEGKKVVHDGLHGDTLKLYHKATQMLCSCVHPKFEKDQRYDTKPEELLDPCLMRHQIQSNQASGTSEAEEQKGVLHLVQGWIQQKQPEKCWYHATRPVALVLATIFKELSPKEYEEFKAAFEAGVWLEDNPGPWLGRAIIYKLDGLIHVDSNDKSPTVSFPCGEYDGEEMMVPQLCAKFSYLPAEIFHKVAKWNPHMYKPGDDVTPGCTGQSNQDGVLAQTMGDGPNFSSDMIRIDEVVFTIDITVRSWVQFPLCAYKAAPKPESGLTSKFVIP
ncbi:hypothetical protein L208DRAFT_1379628 [Tricholoma matsutake]|nr:hypothetical protein L208DRAFT_1379628 [Tricholoma matsutake 945]